MDSSGLTLDQVKAHLRKKYKFFDSPKKSDRLFLTEEHWQMMDWTEEEKYINAALPHKMWNMRHDDHIWPFSKRFRGEDAYGHRAGEGHDKYLPLLPRLVKGRGIARWMSPGDESVIYIPLFEDYKNEWTEKNIPDRFRVYEMKHNKRTEISMTKDFLLANYAPSSIQKFSDKSMLIRAPFHWSRHKIIMKRDDGRYYAKPDIVAFARSGMRWDSFDSYFIKNAKYAGLRWN